MNCPSCHKDNPPGSRFCQHCGHELGASKTAVASSDRTVSKAQSSGRMVPTRARTEKTPTRPAARRMGEGGKFIADIWGPFAGYGDRGHHASWLLDDLGHRDSELHEAITQRFRQRQVPQTKMNWKKLTGRGVIVERRPFYLIRRGITTVALYIGQFGKDLFISQVTYAKGPISYVRVLILALMLLFQIYFTYGYTNTISSTLGNFNPLIGGSTDFGDITLLLCVVGPLGFVNSILLWLALFYSVYKLFKTKDFFALLRVPPNEFQLDDIIALEKSVEETVRQSLDAIGLDSALMPPAEEYGFRRRII